MSRTPNSVFLVVLVILATKLSHIGKSELLYLFSTPLLGIGSE